MAHTQKFSFGRLSNVDLRLLRVFATIVEAGGFAEAQVQLGAAASTISTDMTNLEKRLGLTLCSRGRAGFGLTEEGRLVHDEIQKLFAAVDAFGSGVAAIRGEILGALKIGIIDNSVFDPATRMPETIYRFIDRYPDVQLTVEVLSPLEIETALLEGHLHLGVGVFQRKRPAFDYHGSFSETLDLYCGHKNPLFAAADGVSPQDLAEAKYAKGVYLPAAGPDSAQTLATASASSYQAEGLAFLILSGRFIGYLPRRYAALWVERGMMRALLPAELSREAEFHIITRKDSEPTPVLRAFLREVTGSRQKETLTH